MHNTIRFLILSALLALAPAVHAQTKAVVKNPSTNRLTEALAVPSGITLTIESGATITAAAGSTVTGFGSGGASALDGLTDVTITSAATGQILRYNGTAWVNYTHDFLTATTAASTYLTTAAAASGYQPLDSDLTAIAALTTTSYGRSFLSLADAAAGRTLLDLGELATQDAVSLGSLSVTGELGLPNGGLGVSLMAPAADRIFFYDFSAGQSAFLSLSSSFNISGTELRLSTVGVSFGGTGATSASAARTNLGLEIGADVQAYNADTSILGSSIDLTSEVTGTLPVGSGGTGQTTYTDGQILIGNTATGGVSKSTITAGSGIAVTNGNGTITIAATGGGGGGGGADPSYDAEPGTMDVTGTTPGTVLSAAITPSADTRRVKITAMVHVGCSVTNSLVRVHVFRGSTEIGTGTTAGSRSTATSSTYVEGSNTNGWSVIPIPIMLVDEPATGSSVTYTVRLSTDNAGTTAYLNRGATDTDAIYTSRPLSTLLLEDIP